jgi:2-polyprenyl-3-methyl-5-hydroxy-6-metoxy-1,4-benzoquinol methylase
MPDTRAAYEAWHERYEVDREADAPWHRLVKRYLAPARDLASRRVLEIACGRGGFAAWLGMHPSAPARLVAADFARAAVVKAQQHARRSGLHRAWFGVADIENLPYAPGAFDTVVCCETIEHVPRPRRALAELARVLAPRGRLFLTTPNYLGPLGCTGCIAGWWGDASPRRGNRSTTLCYCRAR